MSAAVAPVDDTLPIAGRRVRLVVAAALLVAGAACAAQAAYIPVKALVAQVLLARAWSATMHGDAQAKPWPWADTHPVARLVDERRGEDVIVLAGAQGRTLAFAPGHVDGTALPGARGNSVVGGHRDTHFAFLRDVATGDELFVETPQGARVRYVVEGTAIVDERDTRALAPTGGTVLTLVTCWPFDAVVPGGSLRYVVRAVAS